MRLRFTRRALRNLDAIADYLRERDPAAATHVRRAIEAALDNALAFPGIGRRQSVRGVRKLVTSYGHLIYYAVDDEAGDLIVLAIRHSAQARAFEDD